MASVTASVVSWHIGWRTSCSEALLCCVHAAAIVGVCANVYKQNMIFPAPQSSGGENKNQSKSFVTRAVLRPHTHEGSTCKLSEILPTWAFADMPVEIWGGLPDLSLHASPSC